MTRVHTKQPGQLQGRTILITGAATGIGREMARLFATAGATLLIHYNRSAAAAQAVAAELRASGGQASIIQADLAQPALARQLVEEAWQQAGPIHVWVNNAGADILTEAAPSLPEAERLQQLVNVDLLGTVHCCWQVAPKMRAAGGGVIINMSWDLAQFGMAGRSAEMFAAVKAGISGFSKSLARSYAPQVRVNDLAPGWIETRYALDTMPAAMRAKIEAQIPLGRFGLPIDVARAALYLASDAAAFVTGQTLRVNGGWIG